MSHLTTHKYRESSYLRAYKAPVFCLLSSVLCLLFFTTVEKALQISSFLTNKANFQKSQVNVTSFITKDYENKRDWTLGENKPNSKPIKANQSQSKPIKANKMPKQTQSNPIQTQFPKSQNEHK